MRGERFAAETISNGALPLARVRPPRPFRSSYRHRRIDQSTSWPSGIPDSST